MDTSGRFFGKLQKLAVFLETEKDELQRVYKNPDDDEYEGAVKVLHELHTEVRDLRVQIREQLTGSGDKEKEMRTFIQSCLVLKQRTTEDIQRLKRHYEKYGYKAPGPTQKHLEEKERDEKVAMFGELEEKDIAVKGQDSEEEAVEEKEEDFTEDGEVPCVTPAKIPPLVADTMRTPRLSDFGLSKFHLMKSWGGLGQHSREDLLGVSMTPPAFVSVLQPVPPKTPKCALRMDDDTLTPRLEDFGITEHTMPLNNDFTMDLMRRNPGKSRSEVAAMPGSPQAEPAPGRGPSTPVPDSMNPDTEASEYMESPEPPLFCTPGFKITKKLALLSPSLSVGSISRLDLRSPPEPPTFETPYMKKLINTVKPSKGVSEDAPIQEEKNKHTEHSLFSGAKVLPDARSCDLANLQIGAPWTVEPDPEMPRLESLHSSSRASWKQQPDDSVSGAHLWLKDPPLSVLEEQELHTLDWGLSSPPAKPHHPSVPQTPEMPDVSSFTQDICKFLSTCNMTTSSTAVTPNPKLALQRTSISTGKENRVWGLAPVSEEEFMHLPGYLRQMSLTSLNQSVQKINCALEDSHRAGGSDVDPTSFLIEDLKRITGTGLKAHVYFLCLTELRRLEHVQGEGSGSVYRALTHA